jgi:uncharacterized protein (TIGR02145 family)
MKIKLAILIFSLTIPMYLRAQNEPNIFKRSSEGEIRQLFEKFGFKITRFITGMPDSLNGAQLFSSYNNFSSTNESVLTATFRDSGLSFEGNDSKISSKSIQYTLYGKRPDSAPFITFIGSASWVYEIMLTEDKSTPMFLRIYTPSLINMTLKDIVIYSIDNLKLIPQIALPKIVMGVMKDTEGNSYKTITLNSMTWMAENLKTAKLADGSDLQLTSDPNTWGSLTSASYCKVWDNPEKFGFYGNIYNNFAVETGKLCPTGWHVPSKKEWEDLFNAFGGMSLAGDYLKSTDKTLWSPSNGKPTNVMANNKSGFTVLPAGLRYSTGSFNSVGFNGYFWSSEKINESSGWAWIFLSESEIRGFSSSKQTGMSVRCIKNK